MIIWSVNSGGLSNIAILRATPLEWLKDAGPHCSKTEPDVTENSLSFSMKIRPKA